jgi:hypothetical protein
MVGQHEQESTMVIEFHELRKRWLQFEAVMQQLMQKYAVTHVHAKYPSGEVHPGKSYMLVWAGFQLCGSSSSILLI